MEIGLLFASGDAGAAAASGSSASRSAASAAEPGFDEALCQELGRASGQVAARVPATEEGAANRTGTSSEARTVRVLVTAETEPADAQTIDVPAADAEPTGDETGTPVSGVAGVDQSDPGDDAGDAGTADEPGAGEDDAGFDVPSGMPGWVFMAPVTGPAAMESAAATAANEDGSRGPSAPRPSSNEAAVRPRPVEARRTSTNTPPAGTREAGAHEAGRALRTAGGAESTAPVPASGTGEADASSSPGSDIAVRSLDRLAPAFRGRLERVLQRMQDELGLDVRVAETWRSQERQDLLFEQGRSAPGPVVTWTRHSNHTRGLAADVAIDAPSNEDAAWKQLARVAAEEGLRTLAPDDPGHIELANDTTAHSAPAAESRADGAPAGITRVARIAGVAHVARVASVAAPGRTGSAGASSRGAAVAAQAPTVAAPTNLAAVPSSGSPVADPASDTNGSQANAAPSPSRHAFGPLAVAPSTETAETADTGDAPIPAATGSQPTRPGSRRVASDSREGEPLASELSVNPPGRRAANVDGGSVRAAAEPSPAGATDAPAAAGPLSTASGPDIAERVARVLMLRDAAAAAPATGVTMMLDGADGAAARIRLALRGNAVGATIDTTDPVEALELAGRTGELQRVLEKHGLETSRLTVREAASGLASDTRVNTIDAAATWLRSGGDEGRRPSQDGSQPRWRDDAGSADTRQQRRNPKEERK